MKKLYFLLLLPLIAFSQGCNIINPHEKTPVYVHIDSVHFVPKPNTVGGTPSQKITSVYAYFNNSTIGVFTLPATIPILTDTPGVFSIMPAVPYDGINGEQVAYPFFSIDTMSIQSLPAHVYQFNAKTGYTAGLVPALPVDFEGADDSALFTTSIAGTTPLRIESDPAKVFEGAHSGAIYLDSSTAQADIITTNGKLLSGTQQAYLELNYKCNTSFAVGLYSVAPDNSGDIGTYIVTFVAHPNSWNKAYVDLRSVLTTYGAYTQHIVIHAQPDAGLSNAYVLLDNLRIVYY